MNRRRWLLLVAWEIPLLLLIATGLRVWGSKAQRAPGTLGLRLAQAGRGQLRVEWNGAAEPVRKSALGRLDIIEGIERQTITLTPAMLASGNYTHLRVAEDADVRLVVIDPDGNHVTEETGFLGQRLEIFSNSAELAELQEQGDKLEAQARSLRARSETQAARIQRLEVNLRALEAKLGIVERAAK